MKDLIFSYVLMIFSLILMPLFEKISLAWLGQDYKDGLSFADKIVLPQPNSTQPYSTPTPTQPWP